MLQSISLCQTPEESSLHCIECMTRFLEEKYSHSLLAPRWLFLEHIRSLYHSAEIDHRIKRRRSQYQLQARASTDDPSHPWIRPVRAGSTPLPGSAFWSVQESLLPHRREVEPNPLYIYFSIEWNNPTWLFDENWNECTSTFHWAETANTPTETEYRQSGRQSFVYKADMNGSSPSTP